jgi:diguanylate cyclase (GGDEF)-like protein
MSTIPNPTRPAAGGRDALTAALPRSVFVAMLEREVAQADASGKPFSVCLLDIDDFRKVNACLGFRAGDKLLAAVADAARTELCRARWRDVPSALGRYDGDEIAVVLRHADCDGVREFGRAVAAAVEGAEHGVSTRIKLSVAAVVYEFGEATDGLLARLERTLHLCKQFGEGAVEVARAGGWERSARTLVLAAAAPTGG